MTSEPATPPAGGQPAPPVRAQTLPLQGLANTVQMITDEAGLTAHYAAMARDNRQFAKFNKIGIDADGNPDPGDLHAAWAAVARGFRLAPR